MIPFSLCLFSTSFSSGTRTFPKTKKSKFKDFQVRLDFFLDNPGVISDIPGISTLGNVVTHKIPFLQKLFYGFMMNSRTLCLTTTHLNSSNCYIICELPEQHSSDKLSITMIWNWEFYSKNKKCSKNHKNKHVMWNFSH